MDSFIHFKLIIDHVTYQFEIYLATYRLPILSDILSAEITQKEFNSIMKSIIKPDQLSDNIMKLLKELKMKLGQILIQQLIRIMKNISYS